MKNVAGLVVVSLTVFGQDLLTVREAVDRAQRSNLLVAAARSRVEAAQALQRQASFRPNPRLTLQQENIRSTANLPSAYWTFTDTFAFLQQPLEASGRRQARLDLAGTQIARTESELEQVQRQLGYRVKLAYWQAAGAQRIEQLWKENIQTMARVVEYHEARVREGVMAEADLLRVRLELERLSLESTNATFETQRTRINLLREMGATEFPELRLEDPTTPDFQLPESSLEKALEQRPEMRVARQQVAVSRAALAAQRNLVRPNYDVMFGYKRTAGYNTVMGGLQIDLPVWNRNQGNIEASSAELQAAQANQNAAEALVRAEVQAALSAAEARRRQARDLLPRLHDQAEEIFRIALAAYQEGGTDLLRLLDAQRVRTENDLLYILAIIEYRRSVVALEAALGVTP